MRNNISLEYAEALFTISCEEGCEEEYLRDVRLVGQLVAEDGEYMALLRSPNIPTEEKIRMLDLALGSRVKENVLSLLKLLCERNRIELLPLCIENYEKLYNQIKRVIVANVTSAVPLTCEEQAGIKSGLERKTGHRVELVCSVDESILGGVIIKTEDVILNGSLRRRIREVKEVISSEPKT